MRTVLAGVLLTLAITPIASVAQGSTVDSLRWLAGCWRFSTPRVVVDEQWMTPSGGTMLGMSRTVSNGRYREHEFLRIYAAGDTLVYAANPSRQKPTEFRSTLVAASEVVFENPAHDFPQRIRYRLVSRDSLMATVEGDRDGRRQPLRFSYLKTACAPNSDE